LILFANGARIPSCIRGFRFPSSAACGRFFKAEEHCSEGGLIAAPIISEIPRQVGFSRWYDTVEELLQAIVDACSN